MKMNYKLAKQLKEAGFPEIQWSGIRIDGVESEVKYHLPTLSELIGACGDEFGELQRDKDAVGDVIFIAIHRSIKDMAEYGKTPEEAVAKLWLKLNEIS